MRAISCVALTLLFHAPQWYEKDSESGVDKYAISVMVFTESFVAACMPAIWVLICP